EHVALVIPADPDIERKARRRAPVVLEIRADLGVGGVVQRVSELKFEMLRDFETVGVGPHEERVFRVPLENVVTKEVHTHARLEDVLAALVQAGVRQIVSDRSALLQEVLGGIIAAEAHFYPKRSDVLRLE